MEKIEVSNSNINSNNYRKNQKNGKNSFVILLVLIAFSLGVAVMYLYKEENPKIITNNRTISENKVTEEAMEDAIDKIFDAVLCIEVLNDNGETISSGTGFIYEKDDKYGYVLTNAHVVSSSYNIQGLLSNNKTVTLTVLGTDTYTDLAVLRMDVKDVIKVASLGKSTNSKVGNTVFTVGSPMGADYAGTVTKGILSGKDRLIETSTSTSILNTETYIVKVLQTDAAISPGNSGGPLVNLAGDVIGINSLKLVDTQVEGMGFAIPIEDALNYVDTLKAGQKVKRPMIGVQILDMTNKYLLHSYGYNTPSNIESGIVLVKVNNGYPAANAGLKDGDIITKVNGKEVKTTSGFKYELYKHSIGDEIEVTYYRDGKEAKTKIKLDKES